MAKKTEKKASVALSHAERYLDQEKYKKAIKNFIKAGDLYYKINEWRIAEKCYYLAAKHLKDIGYYSRSGDLAWKSANSALLMKDYEESKKYYLFALKSYLDSDEDEVDKPADVLSFIFLCEIIQGKGHQGDSLKYIKRFKKDIDPHIFRNNELIQLVENVSNCIYKTSNKHLEEIFDNYSNLKYAEGEMQLINRLIILCMYSVYINMEISLEKKEYMRDKLIDLNIKLDISDFDKIENHKKHSHSFNHCEVTDLEIECDENLSIKTKPILPLDLDQFMDQDVSIEFRTNYPGDSFIGPIKLWLQLDDGLSFHVKSRIIRFKIVSPEADIDIKLIPKETAIVNQTFPLEVELKNSSRGDATQVKIEFEFPESMRLMRGTLNKSIYSLAANEIVNWILRVKTIEGGNLPIKAKIWYKNADDEKKGPLDLIIPLEVNL